MAEAVFAAEVVSGEQVDDPLPAVTATNSKEDHHQTELDHHENPEPSNKRIRLRMPARWKSLPNRLSSESCGKASAQTFNPDVTLEDLQSYMPHFAGGSAGRKAVVMENLAQLGTGDLVNAPQELQPFTYAEDLKRDGLVFFADLREREYTEKYLQEQKQRDADLAEAKAYFADESAESPPDEVALPEGQEVKKGEEQLQQQQLIGDVEDLRQAGHF